MSSIETSIQQWTSINDKINQLSEQMKILRHQRTTLDKHITEYATTRNIEEIKIANTHLKIVNSNIAGSLTFRYLEKCLSDIIKNETHVKQIIEYIKRTRPITTNKHIEQI